VIVLGIVEGAGGSNLRGDLTVTRISERLLIGIPTGTRHLGLRIGRMGTPSAPINDSKGCGGIMRVAPVGLCFDDPEKAFHVGCAAAAITHGHPTGFLAAGYLAALIASIVSGQPLSRAIDAATRILVDHPGHEECRRAVEGAVELAHGQSILPETVEALGGGWIAEEALAISLFCTIAADADFRKGVLLAVNHSGDSDSTGSITGNLLGALLGFEAIPAAWLDRLELVPLIAEVAEDLADIVDGRNPL